MDLYELELPTSCLVPLPSIFEAEPVLWGVGLAPAVPLSEVGFLAEALFQVSTGNREELAALLHRQGEEGYRLFPKLWPKTWRWGNGARRMLVEVWAKEARKDCKEANHLLFLSACALGLEHVLDALLPFVDRAALPFGEKQGRKYAAVRKWFATLNL